MSIESVYQSLLRRNPDQGAYGTYAGLSDDQIANAIYGSAEYAGLQQPQQQQQQQSSGLDDNAIRQLYQQYLHRDADQGGLDTWRGQSYDQVVQGIVNSGEYAQINQAIPATPMNSGAGRNPVNPEPVVAQPTPQPENAVPWNPDTWVGGHFVTTSNGDGNTNTWVSDTTPTYANKPSAQLSTNPDRTQAFNFVASPYVTAQNPFSKPINNAIQSYLGRPATQQEMYQYSMLLAQNPDNYGWLVDKIQNSQEAATASQNGNQQLIIDPKQGDMTNMWLGASYSLWKPSEESGLSKVTNAIGSAIPLAALGVMTGGAGAALGLGAIAGGALAGGVTGAAGAGLNGGNVGKGALTGALTGALGGAASSAFSGAGNIASGGQNLGSNFTWNLPNANPYTDQFINAFSNSTPLGPGTLSADLGGGSSLPYTSGVPQGSTFQYNPVTGQFDIPVEFPNAELNVNASGTGTTGSGTSYSVGNETYIPQENGTYRVLDNATGQYTTASSLPANASPLGQFGPSYSELGYTPQAGPSNFELGYAPSTNTSPFSGFNPASTLGSLYNTLTNGTGTNTGSGSGPGTGPGTGPSGPGGPGTGPGGNGPGGNGPSTPTTTPNVKIPSIKIPTTTTPNLPTALRNPSLYQSAPGGLYKANTNPFMFGKEQPVQNARKAYDPFAALNVPQIPLTETPNLLAQALRQG